MRSGPIGIFDSGLGGLTVAREIARALPGESLVYLGDTARFPYGPRDLDQVRRYVAQIATYLAEQPVKLIVIACNTATAAGLTFAQQAFEVPVVGVVEPGARAAVQATENRKVGVIGTAGTIESGSYSRSVRSFDAGVTVFSVPTPRFADIVEEGLRLDAGPMEGLLADSADVFVRPSFYEIARDYLDPLKRAGIDTLVLGCTHYPLLSASIQQVVGPRVRLISSAEETAREVAETLERRGQLAPAPVEGGAPPTARFVTTGDPLEFERLGSRIFGAHLGDVERVDVAMLETLPSAATLEVMNRSLSEEASCA
jgi:glutamate racemase